MKYFILTLLDISVSGSIIILIITLLRPLFKRAPKWLMSVLWGMAAIRLILPFALQTGVSLMPAADILPASRITAAAPTDAPRVSSAPTAYASALPTAYATHAPGAKNPQASEEPEAPARTSPPSEPSKTYAPTEMPGTVIGHLDDRNTPQAPKKPDIYTVLFVIWAFGFTGMCLYSVITYAFLKRKLGTAVKLNGNVYESEYVVSPFLLGVVKPKFYLPYGLDAASKKYVLAHEKAHVKALDNLWKPLGFIILALHWFNPAAWLGYILFCRDTEAACDERVISGLEDHERAEYLDTLVKLSVKRRNVAACPLAFGETNIKERVKNVINYRRPALWLVILTIAVCLVFAACFMTDPKQDGKDTPHETSEPTQAPTFAPTAKPVATDKPEEETPVPDGYDRTVTMSSYIEGYRDAVFSMYDFGCTTYDLGGEDITAYLVYDGTSFTSYAASVNHYRYSGDCVEVDIEYRTQIASYPKELYTEVSERYVQRAAEAFNTDVSSFIGSNPNYGSFNAYITENAFMIAGECLQYRQAKVVYFNDNGVWREFGDSLTEYPYPVTGFCVKDSSTAFICCQNVLEISEDDPRNTDGAQFFASFDGGISWERIEIAMPDPYTVGVYSIPYAFSPVFDGERGLMPVRIVVDERAHILLFETTDGGHTWSFSKEVHRLVYDFEAEGEPEDVDIVSSYNVSYREDVLGLSEAESFDYNRLTDALAAWFVYSGADFTAYATKISMYYDDYNTIKYAYADPIFSYPKELYRACVESLEDKYRQLYVTDADLDGNAAGVLYGMVTENAFLVTGEYLMYREPAAIFFNDNGTWREFSTGNDAAFYNITGFCVKDADAAFIASSNSVRKKPDGTLEVFDGMQLYASFDGGSVWEELLLDPPEDYMYYGNVSPLYALSPVFEGEKGYLPVAYYDYNRDRTHIGVYESDDGGHTFRFAFWV